MDKQKIHSTTIIPNPTWGKTLELLQEKGSIKIDTISSEKFKAVLHSLDFKFSAEDCAVTKLTKFTLDNKHCRP